MRKAKSSLLRAGVFLLLFFPACSFAQTKVANDPSRIGVGARILGMGKGYVGVADDLCGIFINPASLPSIKNWQITSMSGKFINEYDYINLGTAFPTALGVAGLGYVGSSIGFVAPAATTEVVDGIRIIPSTTEGVSYGFNNRVILFSLGRKVFENFSAGATLKMFSLDMSGPGISDGTASGNEVDLGLHFRLNSVFKAGLVLQNALPFNMGGKIRWATDTEETLPSTLKMGLSFKPRHELAVNIDNDSYPNRPNLPSLWHIGLEWSPIEFIDLRTGIDQEIVGRGGGGLLEPANNLTAGVGLYFGNFRFDYAYHQYNQVTDNDTHYFSITYGVEKKKIPEVKVLSFLITPTDKSILYAEEITIEGEVLNKKIKQVTINNIAVILKDNKFQIELPLRMGKNSFMVQGYDDRGKSVDAQKVRILRLKTFTDVPSDHWAKLAIEQLASLGIMPGYPDGTFRPEQKIRRIDFLMDLVRIGEIPTAEVTWLPFIDVEPTDRIAPYLKAGYDFNLVFGYPDKTFRPWRLASRVEGIVTTIRLAKLGFPEVLERPYLDIQARHWAIREITAAKQETMLKFVLENLYPEKEITRAEAVAILSKVGFISERIDAIMDWEKGY